MAIFVKIANFAKIASLQGATFGIQFKSPAAGDFLPVSPFSPLRALLDISALSVQEKDKIADGSGSPSPLPCVAANLPIFEGKEWVISDKNRVREQN